MLPNTGKLAGLTVFITGASRGIGKAVAIKVAQDGANVVIAAKTAQPHPKLPGTIYTACEEVEKAGGKCLPCIVDIRNEDQVKAAVKQAVEKFGGIDILVNNASAIALTDTLNTDMKRYDLMHNINTRGTFLVSKECLPHLLKSKHPHILNMSPPLSMKPFWFAPHIAYTMAKYGMSMCVLGMHEEFKQHGVAVNALWPKTAIYTAAIEMLAGAEAAKVSRKPEILADAAYYILSQDPKSTTGNFFIDENVLRDAGITDFTQYACDPSNADRLTKDFFVDENLEDPNLIKPKTTEEGAAAAGLEEAKGRVAELFRACERNLSAELVEKTRAVFQFEITGKEAGTWYIDLKHGSGKCGVGAAPAKPDATLKMDGDNFFDMFSGKLRPTAAFMTGKLKISGNLQQAMKLEKLMNSLKSKL